MKSIFTRISKLPKWARNYIDRQQQALDEKEKELEILRQAHSVLTEFGGWFTIQGPPESSINEHDHYSLFFLSRDGAHKACVLNRGDVLLCGHRPKPCAVCAGSGTWSIVKGDEDCPRCHGKGEV